MQLDFLNMPNELRVRILTRIGEKYMHLPFEEAFSIAAEECEVVIEPTVASVSISAPCGTCGGGTVL